MKTLVKLFMCLAVLALLPTTIHAGFTPKSNVVDRDGNVLDKDEDAEGAFGPSTKTVDPNSDYDDRNHVATDEVQTESAAAEPEPESTEDASNAEAEPETTAEEDTAQDDSSEAEDESEDVDAGDDVEEAEDEEDVDEEEE